MGVDSHDIDDAFCHGAGALLFSSPVEGGTKASDGGQDGVPARLDTLRSGHTNPLATADGCEPRAPSATWSGNDWASHVFSPERAAEDDGRFWFHNALHHPAPLYPYDEIPSEAWWHRIGAFNTRIFAIPPAYGVDQWILNGHLYLSPVPVTAPDEVAERADLYQGRAGHYYAKWDAIYEQWKEKVTTKFDEPAESSGRLRDTRTRPSSSNIGVTRRDSRTCATTSG